VERSHYDLGFNNIRSVYKRKKWA